MLDIEREKPIFVLIADLALRDGIGPLNKLPGLWERRLDATWKIAVNGHQETLELAQTHNCMGCHVKPFTCAVFYHGWLAGLLNPYGGVIAVGPNEGANEANFIAALEKAASAESAQSADKGSK